MNVGAIDGGRIQAMMEQLKAAASKSAAPAAPLAPSGIEGLESGPAKVNFADALKNSLTDVSEAQKSAGAMGRAFQMGDDSVSLSDVMVSMQKASIGFQATVQVRNKMVSAYQDIMNMQV